MTLDEINTVIKTTKLVITDNNTIVDLTVYAEERASDIQYVYNVEYQQALVLVMVAINEVRLGI